MVAGKKRKTLAGAPTTNHYDLEAVRTKLFEAAEWHSHPTHNKATKVQV